LDCPTERPSRLADRRNIRRNYAKPPIATPENMATARHWARGTSLILPGEDVELGQRE
jgi:hypothetical protein